jgi:hypothetical protein
MSILDRVATTSDCLVVREFVLIFLQVHVTCSWCKILRCA